MFLKLEVVKKILVVVVILVSINFGIVGLIWGQVIVSVLAFFINTHYSGKFLNYNAWQQIKDIMPLIGLAFVAGFFVWWLEYGLNNCSDVLRLIIGGLAGLLVYLGLSLLFKIESLREFTKIILRE